MSIINVTESSFESDVLRSPKPVLLDFYAVWCGPCRMIAPTLEEIAAEHPEITVGKVNVDETPDLARRFRVEYIPLLVVMKDGKEVARLQGAASKNDILALIAKG